MAARRNREDRRRGPRAQPWSERSSRLSHRLDSLFVPLGPYNGSEQFFPKAIARSPIMSFILESPAFTAGQPIPRRHTGDGEDLSPALHWKGVPHGAAARCSSWTTPTLPRANPGFTG